MQRALVPPAHGVDASSTSEILTFGRQRWLREFEECGFIVERDWPMGLFYTGYSAGQGLDLRLRQALATVCGSACRAYPVSYTHLRAHETVLDLVCRLLLEKKKTKTAYNN